MKKLVEGKHYHTKQIAPPAGDEPTHHHQIVAPLAKIITDGDGVQRFIPPEPVRT